MVVLEICGMWIRPMFDYLQAAEQHTVWCRNGCIIIQFSETS